jgi:CheY-like chemotaxis protein
LTVARLLIVDDKASNRELLKTGLEYAGHTVLEAADGEQALLVMKSERPELVLLDIQMPGLNGYEVLERVMADEELRHIPVVAVTAYAMTGERMRGEAAGFKAYVTKPVGLKQLIGVVSRLL